jgi:hypothetical protein
MVSCAFATTGIIEIATARQFNPLFIVEVLQAGSARIFYVVVADQPKWKPTEHHPLNAKPN